GGRQVDGDLRLRHFVPAVAQRSSDALAAFADRSVGQADGLKVVVRGAQGADIHFDFNDAGVGTVHRRALGLEEHLAGFPLRCTILHGTRLPKCMFQLNPADEKSTIRSLPRLDSGSFNMGATGNEKPMSEISDRRRSERYPCSGGVELRRSEGASPVWANLSDLSLGGCYVGAVSTLSVGSEVLFLLRVGEVSIRGRANVKTSNHAVGMGLEFLHLSAEDQQKLEFLVGTLSGTQDLQPKEQRTVVPERP